MAKQHLQDPANEIGLEGVRVRSEGPNQSFPLCLEPDGDLAKDVAAASRWVGANRDQLARLLLRHGAIRFRGFGLLTSQDFDQFLSAFPPFDHGYSGGTSQRSGVVGRVMESTVAPPDRVIPIHQEMAYTKNFPKRLAFFCEVSAPVGGETPICDMRRLHRNLPPRLRDNVERHGLMLHRYFRAPEAQTGVPELDIVHRSWHDTFSTNDPAEAERQLALLDSQYEWIDGGIHIWEQSAGFTVHPQGGDRVWFNPVGGFNFSREVIGDRMRGLYDLHYGNDRRLPFWVTYGNGDPIDPTDLSALYPATEEATVSLPWREGDVMLLDNIYAGHGRNTYEGDRKIRVMLMN